MKMRALWNGALLAESDDTVVVEGNHYFPAESLDRQYFTTSSTHTLCAWKGTASYHTVTVDGVANPDAAWFYPHPTPLARKVKDQRMRAAHRLWAVGDVTGRGAFTWYIAT